MKKDGGRRKKGRRGKTVEGVKERVQEDDKGTEERSLKYVYSSKWRL